MAVLPQIPGPDVSAEPRAIEQGAPKRFSFTRARAAHGQLKKTDHRRAVLFSTMILGAMWLIGRSMRLRAVGEPRLADFRRLGPGPLLFALWHGDFFPVFWYGRRQDNCVIVSRSPDGEILARVLRRCGYRTVRGSSTTGATRAMIDLAREIGAGHDASIAVDGPRGPALRAKPGILLLAKMTGCPVVPLGVGMSRSKRFASWDRFRLPLPMARVVLTAGDPIEVPHDASAELMSELRSRLEDSLQSQRARAEQLVEPHAFRHAARLRGYAASRPPLAE